MLPILNFSNQTFKVERAPYIKVNHQVQLVEQKQRKLFVVKNRNFRESNQL